MLNTMGPISLHFVDHCISTANGFNSQGTYMGHSTEFLLSHIKITHLKSIEVMKSELFTKILLSSIETHNTIYYIGRLNIYKMIIYWVFIIG